MDLMLYCHGKVAPHGINPGNNVPVCQVQPTKLKVGKLGNQNTTWNPSGDIKVRWMSIVARIAGKHGSFW